MKVKIFRDIDKYVWRFCLDKCSHSNIKLGSYMSVLSQMESLEEQLSQWFQSTELLERHADFQNNIDIYKIYYTYLRWHHQIESFRSSLQTHVAHNHPCCRMLTECTGYYLSPYLKRKGAYGFEFNCIKQTNYLAILLKLLVTLSDFDLNLT